MGRRKQTKHTREDKKAIIARIVAEAAAPPQPKGGRDEGRR